jgi:hypothetical protein
MASYSETIESRRGEVLTPQEVVTILKAHGLGIQSFMALIEEVGAHIDSSSGQTTWGKGEQVLWENVFEFLGY